MPLSANLFLLESSILTLAKRATNRKNVATEKRSQIFYIFFIIFFFGGILVGGDFVGGILYGNRLEDMQKFYGSGGEKNGTNIYN